MNTVADSAVLASGRPLPTNGDFRRGEGVAIVLRGRALAAWKAGGSQWTAVSPRLAVARLRLAGPDEEPVSFHVIVFYVSIGICCMCIIISISNPQPNVL